MTTIQVFDPAMCCSTGVCGVEVDPVLVEFSADVDWLKRQGVTVERFNLAQQPQAFASHATIRALLHSKGETALPVILVDGEVKHCGAPHPSRDQLEAWAGISSAPSIFTEQVAELVAIGAAVASNCEPCFRFHADRARELGAADADIRRAVALAQRVKESPAKAMLDLARRYFDQKAAAPAISVVASINATAQGGCCGSTSPSATAAPSKCC
jgi:AhpD family alkylhydroperoxidase